MFTKRLKAFFTAIEVVVVRFDSVSKKLLFCYYNSMNKFELKFF